MATNKQMQTEFAYFSEVWTLFKKYYDVQQDDECWKAIIQEARAISQKYPYRLCKDLLLAVMDELERKGGTHNRK